MTAKQPTHAELVKQIQELQAQADAVRREEVAAVVSQIHALMAQYNLTIEDVGGRKAAKAPGKKIPPKYINEDGETWTGQGRPPRWITDAQAAGRDINEFKVRVPNKD